MENCIFCKIVEGNVPAQKDYYEDGAVVSFPDPYPRAPGHRLVIPAQHYRWFQEMPDDISNKLFRAARQISVKLKEETGADYIELLIKGEQVPHVHVHLIPQKF